MSSISFVLYFTPLISSSITAAKCDISTVRYFPNGTCTISGRWRQLIQFHNRHLHDLYINVYSQLMQRHKKKHTIGKPEKIYNYKWYQTSRVFSLTAKLLTQSVLWPMPVYKLCISVLLPARRYASAVFATATCLSVRPSHAGTVPSRTKAGSWNVHHLIAYDSSFWEVMSRRKN